MAWKLLQTETLTVANTDIEITALTENKFMSVLTHTIPTGRVQLVQYTGMLNVVRLIVLLILQELIQMTFKWVPQ